MDNRPAVDYRGSDWAAVEKWLADELYETYKRMASLTIDENVTNQLRGRASLISMMLDFRNQPTAASD